MAALALSLAVILVLSVSVAAQERAQLWQRQFYGQWEGQEALLHNSSVFFGKLAFGDLDGDGDADLLIGKADGRIDRFMNAGRAGAPVWRLVAENLTAAVGRTEGRPGPGAVVIETGGHAAPALVDIDQDGDLDLFVGTGDGRLMFFRNVGNPRLPVFSLAAERFVSSGFGRNLVPVFADVDRNRSPDLLIGNRRGEVFLLVNQGTQRRAAFCVEFPPADALPTEEPPCRPIPVRVLSVAPENNAAPGLVDWDRDGDLDLFVGKSNGSIAYYENKGTAADPEWRIEQERFLAIDDGGFAAPAFLDANGDGRPDIVIGSSTNSVSLYTNKDTGKVLDVWKVSGNVLTIQRVGAGLRQVVLAPGDLDGDGDSDLLVGDRSGRLLWAENTGNNAGSAWRVKQENLLAGSMREGAAPWLIDLDGDGDLDLLIGGQDGQVWLMRNAGSVQEPQFRLETTNYAGIDVGNDSVPVTTDIDGDGDPDLFVGNRRGLVIFYRNEGSAGAPDFQLAATNFGAVNVGVGSTPAFYDANGDGRADLIVGSRAGQLVLTENRNESAESAANLDAWQKIGESWNEFRTVGYSAPRFVDLNGDGNPDLLIGDADGNIHLWINRVSPPREEAGPDQVAAPADSGGGPNTVGGPNEVQAPGSVGGPPLAAVPLSAGALQSQSGLSSLAEGASTQAAPSSATEILMSAPQGLGPLAPVYRLENEKLADIEFRGRVRVAVGDLDADGLLDLVVGTADGTLVHYRNTGSPGEPNWVKAADNLGEYDAGNNPVPLITDLDADGLPDLVVGTEGGLVLFFRNTGEKTAPRFSLVPDALSNVNVGRNAAPAEGLVNGDNLPDLIVGNFSGHLLAFAREGTAQSLNFKLVDRRFLGVDVGVSATPFVGDMDRDEVPELIIGSDQGRMTVFTRVPVGKKSPHGWAAAPNYLEGIKFPFGTGPRLADIDGDGDMDLITGTEKGTIYFYENDALGAGVAPSQ